MSMFDVWTQVDTIVHYINSLCRVLEGRVQFPSPGRE